MAEERIGIIGGSGLGEALLQGQSGEKANVPTPFGPPAAAPILAEWHGVPVAILARHGAGHLLNPVQVPYRANIYALKAVGCRWILATGAVGSLREEIQPRHLVLVDQSIDKTYGRPASFFEDAAVHVEFAEPTCPVLRELLFETWLEHEADLRVHKTGTYVCMQGPAFSTRAESQLHRRWGADLIGMTLMPEAKLAREAEMAYASIALVTDYDCWKPHQPNQTKLGLLEEIIGHLHAATDNALSLIKAALPRIWAARTREFAAHRSLELAIWSDKSKIPHAAREKLQLIWGRYF
ncbi:MAG: S-methyl-5'-thioadenosine phosphorylase [Phycisphaerales bacterium]|nr:S-methyl-5'-thioadenosine phosphorylase [Phycisphaerales bacterium]